MRFTIFVTALALAACPAFAQSPDMSVRFTEFSSEAEMRVFFEDYASFADEKWHIDCFGQSGAPEIKVKAEEYASSANLRVYIEPFASLADKQVCLKGDIPAFVQSKLH